jgi:hypothetical protein
MSLELLKTIKRRVSCMQAPMIFAMAKFKRSPEMLPVLFYEKWWQNSSGNEN